MGERAKLLCVRDRRSLVPSDQGECLSEWLYGDIYVSGNVHFPPFVSLALLVTLNKTESTEHFNCRKANGHGVYWLFLQAAAVQSPGRQGRAEPRRSPGQLFLGLQVGRKGAGTGGMGVFFSEPINSNPLFSTSIQKGC